MASYDDCDSCEGARDEISNLRPDAMRWRGLAPTLRTLLDAADEAVVGFNQLIELLRAVAPAKS